MAEAAVPARYPVRLDVEYSEPRSRWKALLRLPLSVPVLIFIYLLQSGSILAIWAAILVRGRIPRWLFDFQVAVNRFGLRALGYLLLLTDQYPPFEGAYPLRYEVEYPQRVSRWRLVFWKILTAVPHLFVLWLLQIAAGIVVIIAWFAILLTGRSPRGLQQFVAGVIRWGARVNAYVLSLTDEFPPFSLDADAGRATRRSYVLSAVGGVGVAGLLVAGIVTVFVVLATESQHIETQVSYERLVSGELGPREGRAEVHSGQIDLVGAIDPADDRYAFLRTEPGGRLVEFRLRVLNWRGAGETVPMRASRFRLVDTRGDGRAALLVTGDGMEIAPFDIDSGDFAAVAVLFELPAGTDPAELQYDVLEYVGSFGEQIDWEFR